MRRGFTLVEVLVAVAVVTILIALVSGALFQVRNDARRIRCVSNCRNCATMILTYAGDYSDYFPHFAEHRTYNAFTNGGIGCPYFAQAVHWPLALRGYLNPQPMQVEPIQLCPGNTMLSQRGYDDLTGQYPRGYVFPSDYHLASGAMSDPTLWSDEGDLYDVSKYRAVKVAEAEYPSQKGMLIETIPRHIDEAPTGRYPDNWIYSSDAPRYAYTTTFVDGHSGSVPFLKFLAPSKPRNLPNPAPVISTFQGILGRDVP